MSEIVVVEDEVNLRDLVRDLMSAEGHQVTDYATVAAAEAGLATNAPDLIITDVKLPDGDGIAMSTRLAQAGLTTPVIVMTAFGTVERAVSALQAGAADFLVKPFDNDRLIASVAAALRTAAELEDIGFSAATVSDGDARRLIGAEGGLSDIVALLPRVAASDATVLIHGESGTGKELIARAIHARSGRRDEAFVSLNCAAIVSTLLESELFGFERGAFTGAHAQKKGHVESANGGTLFLDEIGDMSLEAQVKLLRVLQEREITRVGGREAIKVDVRVVAATHRDLVKGVAEGTFREDLLYRLNVVPIELPPLRERKEDIRGLVQHFLSKHSAKHNVPAIPVDDELLTQLNQHDWPGNVRELENFVERALVLGAFDLRSLERSRASRAPAPIEKPKPVIEADGPVRTLKEVVSEAERKAVVVALRASGGNKAQAARLLGVSYKTLFNKINEYGIKEAVRIE